MRLLNRIGRRRWVCLVPVPGLAVPVTVLGIRAYQAYCPYPHDARAYAQPDCTDGTTTTFKTLNQSLSTFHIPLPHDAQGVRFYIDPGAFRSGYAFYLRFAASPHEVTALLSALGSSRSTTPAEATWESSGSDTVPWKFDDSARYAVYTFTDTTGEDIDSGVAIVDQSPADPVVYLYIYSF